MSKRLVTYNTKQSESIISFLETQRDRHLRAAQIVNHFKNHEINIGRTTIYRQLERLVSEGAVRRYFVEGFTGACFQFVPENERNSDCFHLKCDECGNVSNLNCGTLKKFSRHLLNDHEFQINDGRTVFYGKCKTCLKK